VCLLESYKVRVPWISKFMIRCTGFGFSTNFTFSSIEHSVISLLANTTLDKWDKSCEKPISFRNYVNKVLVPGDKSDKTITQKRNETVNDFINWLENNKHQMLGEVKKSYEDCSKVLKDMAKENRHIFNSVYALLKKLKETKTPHTIILRTYGKELDSVIHELEKQNLGIKFKYRGRYIDQQLSIEIEEKHDDKSKDKTEEKKTELKKFTEKEAYELFIESNDHFAIQDDRQKGAERGRSGKTFLYDQNSHYLSLFFGDTSLKENDMVRPCEIFGHHVDSLSGEYVLPVVTKDAIIKEDYYLKQYQNALEKAKSKLKQ